MTQRILAWPTARWARRLALSGLATGAAIALVIYFWLLADLPPASAAAQRLVRPTTVIVDRNGRTLYEVLDPDAGKQFDLSLDDIPAACVQATLATEDSRFYRHPGIDPIAIARAAWQNLRGRTVVSGGSTLTQQLARALLLPPEERYEQSLRRKLREAWLAWRLEQVYSKDELLALYLNQTYYGSFAFGIEAAAQVFFAKPAAQLSHGECAVLAGLVQYPVGYNPLLDPDAAKARQFTVLRLMHESGFVNADQKRVIAGEPLRYRSALFDIRAPHFVMYVQDLVVRRIGVDRLAAGGLRIVTTLDLDLQTAAETAVKHRLDLLNCRTPGLCDADVDPNRRVDNAAAVILDSSSGDILSMIGSPDYFDAAIQGNVNAALSLRQPGSAIKPFTYAAALDPLWIQARAGLPALTPASILPDLPVTFYVRDEHGGNVPYQPLNYDRRFHGPVSVRTALANSYNIPAVRVLNQIGVPALTALASQAGITSFTEDYGLALTLGGGEVKLLDLTTAFGTFQDGRRLDTQAIVDIQARDDAGAWQSILGRETASPGQAPLNRSGRGARVLSPQAAYLITDILSDTAARMPAFGTGTVLDLPFPAAVKTGTTSDWRDNWTIGYSTRRIVGVWVGNADNTPMLDVSGIDGAGPIWHDLMLAAHPQRPPSFAPPQKIVEAIVCAPSGLLPSANCGQVRRERFIEGTQPTTADDMFQAFDVDLATGQLADASTPAERRARRVYWVLPPEYHDWMMAQGIPQPPLVGSPGQTHTAAATEEGPLVLTSPTSNTAYRIHPGVPRERQRIEVVGYVASGEPWAELRLVVDGETLAAAQDSTRLSAWWVFAPGTHQFRIEGRRTVSGQTETSASALVVIDDFSSYQTATLASSEDRP